MPKNMDRLAAGYEGMAGLGKIMISELTIGFIESVVVSSEYRGRHLGRQLMEHILHEAKRLGVDNLHLTSNPNRVAANALYQSLGFKQYDTNMYKMEHLF